MTSDLSKMRLKAWIDGVCHEFVPAVALTAQAAEIARLKEGYRDAVGGLQYILMHHGRLSGVGFDRVFNTYRALTGSQSHDKSEGYAREVVEAIKRGGPICD